MRPIIEGLAFALAVVRPLILGAAVLTGIAAIGSWAARTRRISPFSPIARFTRQRVDPMFAPAEKRLLLSGGQPAQAPWWTLGAVVVGGLLFISAMQFIITQLAMADVAARSGPRGIIRLLITWTFAVLKLGIIARVIASWVGGSPYKKLWRWAFVITDPILVPLRRVLPTFGPIDVSPLVAYFGLSILQAVILSVI